MFLAFTKATPHNNVICLVIVSNMFMMSDGNVNCYGKVTITEKQMTYSVSLMSENAQQYIILVNEKRDISRHNVYDMNEKSFLIFRICSMNTYNIWVITILFDLNITQYVIGISNHCCYSCCWQLLHNVILMYDQIFQEYYEK